MSIAQSFYQKHENLLGLACQAVQDRGHWTPYPEVPSGKIYGANAKVEGADAYLASLHKPFTLQGPAVTGTVGEEVSPYNGPLGIQYDAYAASDLVSAAKQALPEWRDAGAEVRTGICLEILERLNKRSFEVGNATMHTTGQGFAMAFQAGGPHAQDRGLEAIATTWLATSRVPNDSVWNKPQGKHDPLVMNKRYHIVPKGVALVVACSTFPTWNTYPGLFASLVTGNPVIIKPHSQAILPVAITVQVCQQVLAEAGFDPKLVMLAAEGSDASIAQVLATHKDVRLIDYTGGNGFGDWLSANATQATLYKEQAGVNTILIDSVVNLKRAAQNLAFSLSLYSGQMCTTPQALLIPKGGIDTDQGHLSFDEVSSVLCTTITKFLSDPDRAAGVLGAIPNPATVERLAQAKNLGKVVLESQTCALPGFDGAVYHTPLILSVEGSDEAWQQEQFGPISFIVAVDSTEQGLELISEAIAEKGAITFGVYSTDESVLESAEKVAIEQGVALSCNLDAGVFVNQSAAFSDFHATGNNPAANAALTDPAFVAGRFAVVQSRRHTSV
ncbi:phenylacetic acid degradation protein PaaN [Neptuniibacter sp. UBA847]|uniref:phenylacetic acid degradation protein PaaN n=1 Tax=Neptuniibacter sp. UBA847 TaxID=1946977 RepID=UPI000C6B6314|nr:phenylacetic acid degradation protein PaaN [Neptuniibacter sp. UBA847]MAY41671.1 phenylacetic acid degradation protein PaaN [Oceanospirillaceae bacterium]|tara:strand:+ start:26223 stop:27896 length:1674 start_codon:yes stop_codon:yes gene_type:complete